LRTKARIRGRKHERIHRQANARILGTLSADQRKILRLSQEGYEAGEIARELALPLPYVSHFMEGLVQRLTHEGLIPSPEWRCALEWAQSEGVMQEQ
jgi:DNA-binding NarL/FixJ family response regulator